MQTNEEEEKRLYRAPKMNALLNEAKIFEVAIIFVGCFGSVC